MQDSFNKLPSLLQALFILENKNDRIEFYIINSIDTYNSIEYNINNSLLKQKIIHLKKGKLFLIKFN